MPESVHEEAVVRIANGARTVEALLLDELEACLGDVHVDPDALSTPIRVVVPSRSLRDHLAARLVRHRGRALLGVYVQTLNTVAHEILERAGEASRGGEALFPVLVKQSAHRESALARELEPLEDGYAVVAATVADLHDAGLEAEHSCSLDELLASRGGAIETRRAQAIVRVAADALERMRAAGVSRSGEHFARAQRVLDTRGAHALPSRAVFVHGFAEATGRAGALLEALARTYAARVFIDHPPRPVAPSEDDPGVEFTRRLRERLERVARLERAASATPPPELRFMAAPGAEAEVRAVALRVRRLLDDGERAEDIALVARTLSPYAVPLRIHLTRLGVPFSALGCRGPLDPAGRRIQALLEVLRRGDRAAADRWLDALGRIRELGSTDAPEPWRNPLRADLSLGLHALGAGRLGDVAALDLDRRLRRRTSLPLPVRRGFAGGDEEGDGAPARAARRHLPHHALEAALRRARSLRERLERGQRERSAAQHLARLRAILEDDLGWLEAVPGHADLSDALRALDSQLPADLALSFADFVFLLGELLADAGRAPLGGEGGGVQILDVMEARARTFDHLFLLGMNRDVFPRAIVEDPLLSDALRARLADVLPDIPIKGRAHAEESYLYAQLLSSSPRVTLSWQTLDDDGAARAPSSLVERHRLADSGIEPEQMPPLWTPARTSRPRPAWEHAVVTGLGAARERFHRALRVAIRAERPNECVDPDALADARMAVLREWDPNRTRAAALGPYFGFVGRPADGDPRGQGLYVTTLERLAGCPWQTLLTRLLRIEATPDALDTLPALDARVLGAAVHAALEAIVKRLVGEEDRALGEIADREPVRVPWPDAPALEAIVLEAARHTLLEEGVELPGLARALATRARPFLERARASIWSPAPEGASTLGAEVGGHVRVEDAAGLPLCVGFRADLVEKTQQGLRLTDYKTGRPVSRAAQASTRRRHFLEKVGRGEMLQAVAYQLGAGQGAEGRYVYLRPDCEPEQTIVRLGADAQELVRAFSSAVRTLLAAWEAGVFFPRLLEPDGSREPHRCSYCQVAEACLRGDSGARRRLARWTEEGPRRGPAEEALSRVWRLGTGAAS